MMQKDHRLPLYYQLMDILVEKINAGDLKEHDRLPSERELCEMYDVSRTTVRQAMQELERENYIYKQHGKGSFVSPKIIEQSLLKFYSFTEEMKKINKVPSTKVLAFEKLVCEGNLAIKMGLEEGESLYKVTRLRLADETPMLYETSYLPEKKFPNLKADILKKQPMYTIFNDLYNVKPTRADERFRAVPTSEQEAKLLRINQSEPSLLIERLTYENETIVEYTSTIARGDKFTYSVELK